MDTEARFTIEDLAGRTGLSRRTIRFYVERGLLDPPAGRGRGGFYDESHLARLLEIKKAREEGRSLGSIKSVKPMEFGNHEEFTLYETTSIPGTYPKEASTLVCWELAPGLSLQVEEPLFAENRNLIQAIISIVQGKKDTAGTKPETEGETR